MTGAWLRAAMAAQGMTATRLASELGCPVARVEQLQTLAKIRRDIAQRIEWAFLYLELHKKEFEHLSKIVTKVSKKR